MSRILTLLIVFISCSFSSELEAQNQKVPCDSEKYQEFNFWEGDWNVYNSKGKLIGTNKLVKMQSNCVMQENWESKTSISRGTSYNYYNKTDDSWNQLWVDNSGYSLILKGKLVGRKMILKSSISKGKNGDYINRITWTPNEDGSVTQVWDYLNTKGEIIQEAFKGIYKKKK